MTAFLCTSAHASVAVSVNGVTHTIPQTNEKGWGTNVTAWIQAISQYTLQPSGGTFTLNAEVYTGATYGFKVPYIKTATATPSTAGVLRLARTDSIGWRNQAGDGNLLISADSSNNLTFSTSIVPTSTQSLGSSSSYWLNTYTGSVIAPSGGLSIEAPTGDIEFTSNDEAAYFYSKNSVVAPTVFFANAAGTKYIGLKAPNTITGAGLTFTLPDGDGSSGQVLSTNAAGALSWASNVATATALASNPSDCGADTYATTIAANGNLTCATVTNAGLAGSIAASKLVGSDIATVGTITSGTWSGTTVAIAKGGTGQTTAQAAIDALLPSQGGNSGKFLTTNATTASWGTVAGTALAVATKDTTYTATTSDDALNLTASGGAWTLTLYTAVGNTGKVLRLVKTGNGTTSVLIDGNSSETIGGVTGVKLTRIGDHVTIISDGANWQILSSRITAVAHYNTTNAFGSTNTKIRKWSTAVENTNSTSSPDALTSSNDATNGLSITVNLPGVYAFEYCETFNGADAFGLSLNSAELTTDVTSATLATVLVQGFTAAADQVNCVSWTGSLNAADVIRPHTRAAGASSVPARGRFHVQRVN